MEVNTDKNRRTRRGLATSRAFCYDGVTMRSLLLGSRGVRLGAVLALAAACWPLRAVLSQPSPGGQGGIVTNCNDLELGSNCGTKSEESPWGGEEGDRLQPLCPRATAGPPSRLYQSLSMTDSSELASALSVASPGDILAGVLHPIRGAPEAITRFAKVVRVAGGPGERSAAERRPNLPMSDRSWVRWELGQKLEGAVVDECD